MGEEKGLLVKVGAGSGGGRGGRDVEQREQ